MTTIVFDFDKQQIACDSRQSSDGFINSDAAIKYRYVGAVLWFLSGDFDDINEFISNFAKDKKSPKNYNCSGLFVSDGAVYSAFINHGRYGSEQLTFSDSFGSGAWLAIAALDFDCSAKESVEYAMKRDCFTGGKVHVYDIEKGEFIKTA